jgi:transcriptional regulator with XRE-family HTH domain
MGNDIQDIFQLAAKHYYKKYKKEGGSQAQIAKQLGVTQSYVSAVMSGSRTSSLELQNQIANILYGPYDEFLAAGRRIQKNLDPEPKGEPDAVEENVEKLIARLTYYVLDHQRIEKKLAEIKSFYEDIVQNLQSGVLVTDPDNTVFFANRFMSVIAGIPSEKLLGLNIMAAKEKFPNVEADDFLDKYKQAQKSLQPLFYENILVVTPAGRKAYLSGWLIPQVNESDNTYNGMTCTIRDTMRSQELGMLLKMSLDNSPYAIGIIKQKEQGIYGDTYFTNIKMRRLFGQEDTEPTELTIQESLDRCEKFIINKKEWRQFLQKNFSKGTKGSLVIKHTNGKQYRWTSENLLDNDGQPWGRMAVVKETGRRRRKEDT